MSSTHHSESSSSSSKKRMLCPKCGHERLHRAERQTFMEKKIFPMFGLYPWDCGNCREHFMLKQRYEKVRTRRRDLQVAD